MPDGTKGKVGFIIPVKLLNRKFDMDLLNIRSWVETFLS